jgi:uncharacterized OB-fold protein
MTFPREICGKLFCDECGDYFYPDEAWYCYRCLTKIEHEEDEQLIEPEVEQG